MKRAGMVAIVLGFLPWIAFWSVAGAGWSLAASAGALCLAVALAARQARAGGLKAMEAAGLAFFGANTVAILALGAEVLRPWEPVLASAALATMAWATLLAGTPFTLQYARADWPREYWGAPIFRRVNVILTAAWGAIFTLNAGLALAAVAAPTARVWLTLVLPQTVIAVGVALSIVLPARYPRRWAAREIARRDPHPWPAPTSRRVAPSPGITTWWWSARGSAGSRRGRSWPGAASTCWCSTSTTCLAASALPGRAWSGRASAGCATSSTPACTT
jgi:hypothetical protein